MSVERSTAASAATGAKPGRPGRKEMIEMSKSPNGDARVDGCGEDCVLGSYLDTTLMERDEARAERDALRTAVSDAATERVTENSVRHVKQLTTELQNKRESLNDQRREFRKLLANARAERDAALAAVERVRAIHSRDAVFREYCAECSDFGTDELPEGQMIEWPCSTRAALDGAPEPEWEYQWGEPGESFEGFDSFATEELARAEMELDSEYPSHRVMRRRKAGPWVPVGGSDA